MNSAIARPSSVRTLTWVTPERPTSAASRRLGDQHLAFPRLIEEDDRGLGGDAAHVAAVAGIGEGGVGEREDHAAMGDAVAVQHVGA